MLLTKTCPLCSSKNSELFYSEERTKRDFYHCHDCDLRFLDRDQILRPSIEETRYQNHKNDIRTQGYEKFLRRLITPLHHLLSENRLSKDAPGLDFGQGPYPMLIEILKEDGFEGVEGYDPFFKADKFLLERKYDYITCCEVVEHMSNPFKDLEMIFSLLNSKGHFIISTAIYDESIDFGKWYYIKDDTHINFFSKETIEWINQKFSVSSILPVKDLVIFEQR